MIIRSHAFCLPDGMIATVDICPDRGQLVCSLRLGSDYLVHNHTRKYLVKMNHTVECDPIEIKKEDLKKLKRTTMVTLPPELYGSTDYNTDPDRVVIAPVKMRLHDKDIPPGYKKVTHFGWRDPFHNGWKHQKLFTSSPDGGPEGRNDFKSAGGLTADGE